MIFLKPLFLSLHYILERCIILKYDIIITETCLVTCYRYYDTWRVPRHPDVFDTTVRWENIFQLVIGDVFAQISDIHLAWNIHGLSTPGAAWHLHFGLLLVVVVGTSDCLRRIPEKSNHRMDQLSVHFRNLQQITYHICSITSEYGAAKVLAMDEIEKL